MALQSLCAARAGLRSRVQASGQAFCIMSSMQPMTHGLKHFEPLTCGVEAPYLRSRCRCRFVSPICSAIVVTIIFGFVRTFVLRSQHSFKRAFYVLPFFVMLTFFVIVIFILQTNNKNQRCAPSLPLVSGL